jgi:aminoglycoside 3-N-acetyltransferase
MNLLNAAGARRLAASLLGPKFKRMAKVQLDKASARYVRWRYPFDPDELATALSRIGLREGDTVLAHVAYDSFQGFTGGPGTVIEILQRQLGPRGTLLMPTMPFSGSALDYVAKTRFTDLKRTPSAMGFITEVFRRMPGVLRSCHPTHPVAAWGARAVELTSDHHRCASPCGEGSPYLRLMEVDGKILFLGVDITSMTFYHGVEERLEPDMPVSPFTQEWFDLECRASDGTAYKTKTRLFDRSMSERRDVRLLLPDLIQLGEWRTDQLGRLNISLTSSRAVFRVCKQMAKQGRFCYH